MKLSQIHGGERRVMTQTLWNGNLQNGNYREETKVLSKKKKKKKKKDG